MPTGVIYVMETVVPGIVKIGKTKTQNYPKRMDFLEKNGYQNIAGLHRRFAIEVEDYDEKETMLDEIFSKARIASTELFAIDVELVISLLSSFEGQQIYPQITNTPKEEIFRKAADEHREHIAETTAITQLPDGTYYLNHTLRGSNHVVQSVHVQMTVDDGEMTITEGQQAIPNDGIGLTPRVQDLRRGNLDEHGIVLRSVTFDSPSSAASFVLGKSANGWREWRTSDNKPIDILRK